MKHLTSVKDTDQHFEVRADTREIINQSKTKTKIMQFDHNSERFTFSLPRIIEGHDMTECDSIRVHYNVDDLTTKETIQGVYDVTDIKIDPDNDNRVVCTWLLSQNVTQLAGPLTFVLKCQCYGDDGEVTYSWSTDKCTGFSIIAGLNNDVEIVERYVDVLEQWKNELFSASADGVENIYTAKENSIKAINTTIDTKIGDIESAIDHILALDNEILGVSE